MRKLTQGSLLAAVAGITAMAMLMTAPAPLSGQGKGKGGMKGKAEAPPPGPVPRTADGKPDMSGFWGGVNPSASVSIEPDPNGRGGRGTPLIVGPQPGKVPYTAAARAKSDDIIANRMFLEPELHCFPSGIPHVMWTQFGMQIIQPKGYVMMMWEFQHNRRIIPTDGRAHQLPPTVRQFMGDQVGHWEGDTLVVDTTNQTAKTWFDTSGHYAPEDIHVVERFTMINENQIDYEAVVESPSEFTEPMRLHGMINRSQANDPTYEQMEFGCIEGNRDLQHYTEDFGGTKENVGARTK